jgi:hypothetical protein
MRDMRLRPARQIVAGGAPEYGEHNNPVDRINEVWRAILQMRDYEPKNSPCQKSNPPAAAPNS